MKKAKPYLLLIAYVIALTALLISITSCTQTSAKLFSKRRPTEDEKQLQFFKQQIKIKQYYYANR